MISFLLPRLPELLTADFHYSRLAENGYNLNPTHANMQPRVTQTLKVYQAYKQLAEAASGRDVPELVEEAFTNVQAKFKGGRLSISSPVLIELLTMDDVCGLLLATGLSFAYDVAWVRVSVLQSWTA